MTNFPMTNDARGKFDLGERTIRIFAAIVKSAKKEEVEQE